MIHYCGAGVAWGVYVIKLEISRNIQCLSVCLCVGVTGWKITSAGGQKMGVTSVHQQRVQ